MESALPSKLLPKKITVEFIDQLDHRYDTVGDYGTNHDGSWWFKITDMNNPIYSMAILIHELWEKTRNMQLGITDESVDEFDLNYKGEFEDTGSDPAAPYHKTHMESDAIERSCIVMGGEDWIEYEKELNSKIDEYEKSKGVTK
jgi:hypothetical protein